MEDKRMKRNIDDNEPSPVTPKHTRLDASGNDDKATGDNSDHTISSNNDNGTAGDNSGNDTSSNNSDETAGDNSGHSTSSNNDDETKDIIFDSKDIKKTLKSQLSIFKLANSRLAGFENLQDDMKKFGQCIKEKLIKSGMQHKGDNGDKCQPYHLMHFFYSTKDKDNITAVEIGKQFKYQERTRNVPGDRRSGNILVFYRLKQNPLNTENSIPEAFFICQGFAYQHILCLSDASFRTRVVTRFMDGEKIKTIETLNIAGSSISSKITYKDNCNIAAESFLERVIVSLSGIIVRNSKLNKLIDQDGSKEILMEVGINFVRICKPLQWEEWSKVLELFSDEVDDNETEVDRRTCHILNAFEYVHRVEGAQKSELDEIITRKAICIIANNQPTFSYYLSHRCITDWSLSSNVILSEKHTKRKSRDKITSWNSAPTLIMVIEAINRHFKTPSLIKECLRNRNIVLSYGRETGKKDIPVQDFIHGSVSKDDRSQYFKIGQKWFFLSSTYSQVVDRNFAFLSQCLLLDKRISDLIYPWRSDKLEITTADCHKFLGVSHAAEEQILEKLTQKCKLVDEANHCCLTYNSYLLPESSVLYKELKGNNTQEKKGKNPKEKKGKTPEEKKGKNPTEKKGKNQKEQKGKIKKTRKNTMGETMNNSSDNNTPHQDSGIELVNPMDVGSITDTQSSSSTSNLTSGGDFNTPDVGNDIDQNQTSTPDDESSGKRNEVGKMLHQVLASDGEINDNGVLSVLQKTKREICVKEDGKYFVCNPILTEETMKEINRICLENPILTEETMKEKNRINLKLTEPRLSMFLRCMSPFKLSEGEYNALYLSCEENDDFIIFPGDTVLANNVELFDILIYDKKEHTTYLFQNKEGFDRNTRVACAQIRNASELLWHDFVRGKRTHIELFWEHAVYSRTTETPYRYILKRKLKAMGKNKFIEMFDDDAKIVFVLGFVIRQSKASSNLRWEFKSLTLKDFQVAGLNEDDKKWLEPEGILTKSGYLTDCFIGMTQDTFAGKFKSSNRNIARLKKIHTFLSTKGTCDLSTIAKLELLTLDNCFSRYQIGGKRHYHLKLHQLDSK